MNLPTLPYDNVTYSVLLEIWFWGPTHPTFLYDVTLLDLFFFEGFPKLDIMVGWNMNSIHNLNIEMRTQ